MEGVSYPRFSSCRLYFFSRTRFETFTIYTIFISKKCIAIIFLQHPPLGLDGLSRLSTLPSSPPSQGALSPSFASSSPSHIAPIAQSPGTSSRGIGRAHTVLLNDPSGQKAADRTMGWPPLEPYLNGGGCPGTDHRLGKPPPK